MSSDLLGARRVRELLDRHAVSPHRSLGQNFVIDPNTIRKVLRHSDVGPEDDVLEIGAGAGSLTVALAGAAKKVVAVEKDPRLLPVLGEALAGYANVEVVHADAGELALGSTGATKLVANLPYNLAVTLVLLVLEGAASIEHLTVMTQREAGERLAAGPGSKVYGVTSLLAQFHADVAIAGIVSRNAFWPVPNVDSVIVSLRRRARPDVDPASFSNVVHASFAQRRKMLRNSLSATTGRSPGEIETAMIGAGIEIDARPEDVTLGSYVALARLL